MTRECSTAISGYNFKDKRYKMYSRFMEVFKYQRYNFLRKINRSYLCFIASQFGIENPIHRKNDVLIDEIIESTEKLDTFKKELRKENRDNA